MPNSYFNPPCHRLYLTQMIETSCHVWWNTSILDRSMLFFSKTNNNCVQTSEKLKTSVILQKYRNIYLNMIYADDDRIHRDQSRQTTK